MLMSAHAEYSNASHVSTRSICAQRHFHAGTSLREMLQPTQALYTTVHFQLSGKQFEEDAHMGVTIMCPQSFSYIARKSSLIKKTWEEIKTAKVHVVWCRTDIHYCYIYYTPDLQLKSVLVF